MYIANFFCKNGVTQNDSCFVNYTGNILLLIIRHDSHVTISQLKIVLDDLAQSVMIKQLHTNCLLATSNYSPSFNFCSPILGMVSVGVLHSNNNKYMLKM